MADFHKVDQMKPPIIIMLRVMQYAICFNKWIRFLVEFF